MFIIEPPKIGVFKRILTRICLLPILRWIIPKFIRRRLHKPLRETFVTNKDSEIPTFEIAANPQVRLSEMKARRFYIDDQKTND